VSVSYNVFIKTEASIEAAVLVLESIVNCRLVHSKHDDTDYYSGEVFGVGISLVNNVTFEDDGEIEFSKYNLEVMIEYHGQFDKELSYDFQRPASIVIANMISRRLRCECIAVENMGTVLASYEHED
jgi:hypothetical protein